VTDDALTCVLAERIMGWRTAPGRFLKPGREWVPTSRFKPFARLEHAFLLLDTARAAYSLSVGSNGIFTARVRVGKRHGKAIGVPKARAITLALSRALGIGADGQ
jgi:hypothetical protein